MTLSECRTGETVRILQIDDSINIKSRLLDMGLTENTIVKVLFFYPLKGPVDIFLRGYRLTLRLEYARKITVRLEKDI